MAKEVQAVYTFEDWCNRLIGCDKHYNFFKLHNAEHNVSLLNNEQNLIPVQLRPIDKKKVKEKHIQDDLKVEETFSKLKQSFCTSYTTSSGFFDSAHNTLTAVKQLLFSCPGEELPLSKLEKVDFGSIHLSLNEVLQTRNAVRLIEENECSKHKLHDSKLFIVPCDQSIIAARAYIQFYEWLDLICHTLSHTLKQTIFHATSKTSLDDLTLNDFDKMLKSYFEENLVSYLQTGFDALLNVEDLCIPENFVSAFQLYFFNKCFSKCKILLEVEISANPVHVIRPYKLLLELLSLCNGQSRWRFLNQNDEFYYLDNNSIRILIHKTIRDLGETNALTISNHPIPGLTYNKLLAEIFSTFYEMHLLTTNERKAKSIENFEQCLKNFLNEMYQKYKALYPTFLNNAFHVYTKHKEDFSELDFINKAILNTEKKYINISQSGKVNINVNDEANYEFDAVFYHKYITPLFIKISTFLNSKLSKINEVALSDDNPVTTFGGAKKTNFHLEERFQNVRKYLSIKENKLTNTDIVELASALYFNFSKNNPESKITRKDFMEYIIFLFGRNVKDIEDILTKATARQNNHKFLDNLILDYETYCEEKER